MVHYRLFEYEKDERDVIDLVNKNLTPRNTKEFFKWKYVNYPGGESTGAVAEIDNKIVAVVFYLPFNFYRNEEMINAARPVAGCTAKEYRGRGIFKHLMKFCLEAYNKEYQFLFANPNRFSYPEFLKMGWMEKVGEYRWAIIFPWQLGNKLQLKYCSLRSLPSNLKIHHKYFLSSGSAEIFKWRYSNKRYIIKKFLSGDSENYIIYRIHRKRKLKIIILCDYIGDRNYLNTAIKEVCREEKTCFIYFFKNRITMKIKALVSKLHRRVVITYEENELGIIKKISFSLGDLEGTI